MNVKKAIEGAKNMGWDYDFIAIKNKDGFIEYNDINEWLEERVYCYYTINNIYDEVTLVITLWYDVLKEDVLTNEMS